MFTDCPYCHHEQEVDAHELRLGRGLLSCDNCGRVFDALSSLKDGPADEPHSYAFVEPPLQGDLLDPPPLALPSMPAELLRTEPRKVSRQTRIDRVIFGSLACLLLLGLAAQWLYFRRDQLLRHPFARPYMLAIAARLGVPTPPLVEPRQVRKLSDNAEPHPSVADALLVTLNMSNQAFYPIRMPAIELKLFDQDGRLIGMRQFAPDEYLDEPGSYASGMPPGEVVPVALEIAQVGKSAQYEIQFH
jgi:hypothetical protein